MKKKNEIWKNKQFIYLWSGNLMSELSFSFFSLWLPIVIYYVTYSTLAMSTMRAIQFIPNVILGIFIGILVDRLNRKYLMLSSSSIIVLALLCLVILTYFEKIEIWHIYILGFVIYTASYALGNVYDTLLPLIVEKNQLVKANSTLSIVDSSINLLGPVLAGLVFLFDLKTGLIFSTLGMVLMFFCSTLIKIDDIESTSSKEKISIKKDFKEGWDALTQNKLLLKLTFMILISNIIASASSAVLAFYVLDHFNASSSILGFIFSFAALGGIVASLFANKIGKFLPVNLIFSMCFVVFSIGYLINFLSSNWITVAIGMFFLGFSTLIINIHYISLRQQTTDNKLLGRVSGTTSMIMKIANPLSFISVGFIAEFIDIKNIFITASLLTFFLAIIIFSVIGVKRKELNNDSIY